MKVVGIIAEYNPFHLGHQYQIEYIRNTLKADYVVAVMSGDYVQRGTPAIMPKHERGRMALSCGVDLVLELPVQAATASAEGFAFAGVELLDGLGIVNELCFGSECGEITPFLKIAGILNEEPEEYRQVLKNNLKKGMSFPAARSAALIDYAELLSSPNNILGIEYCRAILKLNSTIRPVTLKREGAGYHEESLTSGELPSASAVRALICNASVHNGLSGLSDKELKRNLSGMIPAAALPVFTEALNRNAMITDSDFDEILHYCLLNESRETLTDYADVSPELADRIMKRLNDYEGFDQFTDLLKTKELTRTRIQRALLHVLLHIKTEPAVPYARILGFRRDSSPLLAEIKKRRLLPLLTKPADAEKILSSDALYYLETNTRASNIYESILCKKENRKFVHEYQKQLVIL